MGKKHSGTASFIASGRFKSDGRYEVRIENGVYLVRVEAPQGFTSITQQVIVNSSIDGQYFIVARDAGVKPDPPENIVNVRGVVATAGKAGRDTQFRC